MKESINEILIAVTVILMIVLAIFAVFYYADKWDEKSSERRDSECRRLGYEKSMVMGFRNYCVKGGERTEVIGNCSPNGCDFVFR